MTPQTYTVTAELWRYPGEGGWHFVALPAELADELRARFSDAHRPFGSLAVDVTLGRSRWSTSLFADTKAGSYLLPVKADVRRREGIEDGQTVTLTLTCPPR